MNSKKEILNLLTDGFVSSRAKTVINHFLLASKKFQDGDWESSLSKAGKFTEAVIKMLWLYAGRNLPRSRDFKAGSYAEKIIKEVTKAEILNDAIRLQIPRACIFIYDVTSNRGARHDAEEVSPNHMDNIVIISMCSWILSELIRFVAKEVIAIEDAEKMVNSLMERKYPIFEAIDGIVYVDSERFSNLTECAILILYYLYPKRIEEEVLKKMLNKNGFKSKAIQLKFLIPFIHEYNNEIILRSSGRKKAEQILGK